METFKASNGVELGFGEHGHIMLDPIVTGLGEQTQEALREFFLHERDQELGRWRDPDSPYLVVYPVDSSNAVRVVDEQTGLGWKVSPETKAYPTSTLYDVVKAGHHYFAAHPAPKPWHDAKLGEVWVVTFEDEQLPVIAVTDEGSTSFQFGDSAGEPSRVGTKNPGISSARRIWPEVVSDG